MTAQTNNDNITALNNKGSVKPYAKPRLGTLLLLLVLLITISLVAVLAIPGGSRQSRNKSGNPQNKKASGSTGNKQSLMRIIDITYKLSSESANPMRQQAQTLATKEKAQEIANLISQKLIQNPGLTDGQVATLSSIPTSVYRTTPTPDTKANQVTVTSPADGVERVTQIL